MDFTISINKANLLETLKRNRAQHSADYMQAFDAYRLAVIKEMKENLKAANKGEKIETYISLREPKSHLEDYDLVIEMLEMHNGEHIDIDSRQYSRLVKDDWDWKREFDTVNSSYSRNLGLAR
jgi:hypothetical protein